MPLELISATKHQHCLPSVDSFVRVDDFWSPGGFSMLMIALLSLLVQAQKMMIQITSTMIISSVPPAHAPIMMMVIILIASKLTWIRK